MTNYHANNTNNMMNIHFKAIMWQLSISVKTFGSDKTNIFN